MKPESFVLTSDYATLKNDDRGVVTVTFPGSTVIPAATVRTYTADIKLGVRGASLRAQISSSKDANRLYACSALTFNRAGSIPSSVSVSYSLTALVSRTSADTVTAVAVVMNPYSEALTTASGDETFTIAVNTFIPPFQ